MKSTAWRVGISFLGLLFFVSPLTANSRWKAGGRYVVSWGAPGTRIGDINGAGGFLAFTHNDRWSQSFGIDHLEYDLETPVHAIGIEPLGTDKPVDSFTIVNRFYSELRYHLKPPSGWDPYVAFELGYYLIDARTASGKTSTGGTFQLSVDTPNTFGMGLRVGSDWTIKQRFHAGVSFGYSQTFQDYTVRDHVSGRSGKIKAFAPVGIAINFSYRF